MWNSMRKKERMKESCIRSKRKVFNMRGIKVVAI